MRASSPFPAAGPQRGATLVELMMALVVLSIGLLAVAQLFPAGARNQVKDRMFTTASYYAEERLEEVAAKDWADPELSLGRHPPGSEMDTLGATRAWRRFYVVDPMPAPLDNLRRVTVTVLWTNQMRDRTVTASTYVRR